MEEKIYLLRATVAQTDEGDLAYKIDCIESEDKDKIYLSDLIREKASEFIIKEYLNKGIFVCEPELEVLGIYTDDNGMSVTSKYLMLNGQEELSDETSMALEEISDDIISLAKNL